MAYVDEQIVLKFYLEQMEKDNIKFLEDKDNYKDNISKSNLLLEEKGMHNRIKIAKNLWKLLFEAAMSYIDTDKRGTMIFLHTLTNI